MHVRKCERARACVRECAQTAMQRAEASGSVAEKLATSAAHAALEAERVTGLKPVVLGRGRTRGASRRGRGAGARQLGLGGGAAQSRNQIRESQTNCDNAYSVAQLIKLVQLPYRAMHHAFGCTLLSFLIWSWSLLDLKLVTHTDATVMLYVDAYRHIQYNAIGISHGIVK
eukprot:6186725-Pleurochrysis_carterae.AAC.6